MDDIIDINALVPSENEDPGNFSHEPTIMKKKFKSQVGNIQYYTALFKEPISIFLAVLLMEIPFVKDRMYDIVYVFDKVKNAFLRALLTVVVSYVIKQKVL